jgi:antitoxin component YwqK of YwqJK toxin-antitoxin module
MSNKSIFNRFTTMVGLALIALSLEGCGEKIDARQTQYVQGLVYKLNSSEPFTGAVINAPSIGQKSLRNLGVGNCTIKFKNGMRDGTSTCISESGVKVSEIELSADEMNGTQKQWDQSGNLILDMKWKNGQPDGLEEDFNSAGKRIAKIHWSNGVKEGNEKGWDAAGEKLIVDLDWEDGKATGFQTVFDMPGGGYHEYNIKDGAFDGVQKEHSTDLHDGTYLSKVENFKKGKADGLSQRFNEDGKLSSETSYKNGQLDGLTKKYDSDGKLWDESDYKDGVMVGYLKDGVMVARSSSYANEQAPNAKTEITTEQTGTPSEVPSSRSAEIQTLMRSQ